MKQDYEVRRLDEYDKEELDELLLTIETLRLFTRRNDKWIYHETWQYRIQEALKNKRKS